MVLWFLTWFLAFWFIVHYYVVHCTEQGFAPEEGRIKIIIYIIQMLTPPPPQHTRPITINQSDQRSWINMPKCTRNVNPNYETRGSSAACILQGLWGTNNVALPTDFFHPHRTSLSGRSLSVRGRENRSSPKCAVLHLFPPQESMTAIHFHGRQ